jgi:uncharacterized protein
MELFAALLRSNLGDQLAPEAISFVDMLADDAVMEFPFAPPACRDASTEKLQFRSMLKVWAD